MGDRTKGLTDKFRVSRVDGTDGPGAKHDGCDYFVLDLTHDPFAREAIAAYGRACVDEYPLLAADLLEKELQLAPQWRVVGADFGPANMLHLKCTDGRERTVPNRLRIPEEWL